MKKEELNDKKRENLRQLNIESNKLTKDCIRTGLLSLMASETFDHITVTAIINRAGVSRGGFYRNYASKEDVLREIAEQLFQYVLEFLSVHKIYDNPKEWCQEYFQKIFDHREEYKLLIKAKAPTDFVFNFDEERLLKELQKDDSTLEHYRAVAIMKALSEIASIWFENGMLETPKEMAEMMCQIFYDK